MEFSMKVLVVGSGGREHALAWRIAQSEHVQTVYVAPGNAGTDADPLLTNVPVKATDLEGLLKFVRENGVDYTACRGHRGRLPQGRRKDLRADTGCRAA